MFHMFPWQNDKTGWPWTILSQKVVKIGKQNTRILQNICKWNDLR